MKVETIHISIGRPRHPGDPGTAAVIHYIVVNGVLRLTDSEGHALRFQDGAPAMRTLGPEEDPKFAASRLGRAYHIETYGDRERGFWRELPGRKDVPV
jgi:hypothetical protein